MNSARNFTTGATRYPAANSAQTSFSLTAGFKSAETTPTLDFFPLNGARGAEIQVGGVGADNDTIDYRVYIVRYTRDAAGAVTGIVQDYFGGGTATLSSATVPGGAAASASERMADTLTWTVGSTGTTPKGIGTTIETATGSPGAQVYSPTGNVPATLYIPHLGWADGIVVEFDATGTTTASFALIARK